MSISLIFVAKAIGGRTKRSVKNKMQVSRSNELEGGRGYYPIGRIKASSGWRVASAHDAEGDRVAAVGALVREAQELDADAIIGLDFEVEAVRRDDVDGPSLQRVAATGIAVKIAEAA